MGAHNSGVYVISTPSVPRPAHAIEAMAAAHRGRVVSEEQKAKQRATWARKRAEKA